MRVAKYSADRSNQKIICAAQAVTNYEDIAAHDAEDAEIPNRIYRVDNHLEEGHLRVTGILVVKQTL